MNQPTKARMNAIIGEQLNQAAEDAREAAMHAAHAAGYDARYSGASSRSNPHEDGSDDRRAWEAGWLQAGSVIREIRESDGR